MSATKLLNELTEELESTWDYSSEEINDIREKLLLFAKAVSEDAEMAQEVKELVKDLL